MDNNRPPGLLSTALSNSSNSLGSMAEILYGRPKVQGLYYNRKTVKLDGYDFINCRFDHCTLEVHTTNFSLVSCIIDPSCSVSYGAAVVKIIKLFTNGLPSTITPPRGFGPNRNADGTITISEHLG